MISVIVNKHGTLIHDIFDAIFLADERTSPNISVIYFFGCHLAARCKEGYLLHFTRPSFHTEEHAITGRKYKEENIGKKI